MNLREFLKRDNLDEMQKQTLLKIESRGFWGLWMLLLAALIIEFAEFGMGVAALQAVIMGVCTGVLCFATLQLSMKAYKKRHAELENPKEDDDENE